MNKATSPAFGRGPLIAVALLAFVILGATAYRWLDSRQARPDSETLGTDSNDVGTDPDHRNAGPRRDLNSPNVLPDSARNQARIAELSAKRQQSAEAMAKQNQAAREAAILAFRNERVDPAWAGTHESKLGGIAGSDAISATGIKPRDSDISCKSRTCRIQADFASRSEAEDWALLFMSSVGDSLPTSVVTTNQNPDGSARVEIYGTAR